MFRQSVFPLWNLSVLSAQVVNLALKTIQRHREHRGCRENLSNFSEFPRIWKIRLGGEGAERRDEKVV
jgi:hypothetical protein